LYVSSSPSLWLEREVVGRVVARLPLTLGLEIDHTPLPSDPVRDSLARVSACDLYLLILGHDFAAPMGAELRHALSVGRQPLAYRKKCTQSPSSQDVVRRIELEWRMFADPDSLRVWVARDLLHALLRQATVLGLDLNELERLLGRAQEEAEHLSGAQQAGRRRGEAGKSGVILGREVWESRS
jgi:GNAT superfamily N-acetyltransferase